MEIYIEPLDAGCMKIVEYKFNNMAKPLKSLGKLEDIMIKCAGIFKSANFTLEKKATIVMCSDNGIVAQNVTQTGSEVTKIVAENMTGDKATISVLCKSSGADVFVVDIGMNTDSENTDIINKKIMYGTNDFSKEKAISPQDVKKAIQVGIDMVKQLSGQGYTLIATGEMGIGNTTTSSAIIACILEQDAGVVTGRGAGLSLSGLEHKVSVINQALQLHKPNNKDMIDVLSKVGGLDIAGLVGVFLGGGLYRVPILIDGFISSTAALVAVNINPLAKDFMFATHVSAEPAGKMVLDKLELAPFLFLDMHLGEGTGAAMAFSTFQLANNILQQMCDFKDINIEKYQEFK